MKRKKTTTEEEGKKGGGKKGKTPRWRHPRITSICAKKKPSLAGCDRGKKEEGFVMKGGKGKKKRGGRTGGRHDLMRGKKRD